MSYEDEENPGFERAGKLSLMFAWLKTGSIWHG